MQGMIRRGAGLILPQSSTFRDVGREVARKNPSVAFEQLNGVSRKPNFGTYSADAVAIDYGLGVAAAKTSKTGKIGFIAARRTTELEIAVIAFVAGAHSVNPDIEGRLVYTGLRPSPTREAAAVDQFSVEHADVVVSFLESPITVAKAAERRHLFVIASYSAAARRFAPHFWLSGVDFSWGPMFVRMATDVLAGTWEARDVPRATRVDAEKAVEFVESGNATGP
jgi:basic membrane protein A and related proteins